MEIKAVKFRKDGLAKTCQFGGLTILRVEGYKRLKSKFKKRR